MSKADRKKGNTQAASSSRAADLLLAGGRNIPFIGFDSLQLSRERGALGANASTTTTTTGSSVMVEIEAMNIDSPQIRAALKRLIKPDPLTKEKALRELAALLRQAADEGSIRDMGSSFTHFAAIYPTLVTDASPTVRTNSTCVLSTFLQLLKREANPTGLKQSLPFLLFSLCDSSGQVVESAKRLLYECFPAEKRHRLERAFAPLALRQISLEIIAGKHQLLQQQKILDAQETEGQRRSRLTSQSLRMIAWALATACNEPIIMDESAKTDLHKRVVEGLSNAQTINSLMGMDADVKSSTLALVKRLAETDPAPFLESKLPSVLLTHLGAPEVPLCRNAFESKDKRLFEVLKVEKAIVPKFLSLLRRKGSHWSVLETALLPSFSLITDQLKGDEECRRKLINAMTESFFEGEIHLAPVKSFSQAFIEVQKYTFLNFSSDNELVRSQCDKLLHFVDTLLEWPVPGARDSETRVMVLAPIADYFLWLESRRRETTTPAGEMIDTLMEKLTLNLINKLPTSTTIIEALLAVPDSAISKSLGHGLVKLDEVPTILFVSALNGLRKTAPSLIPDNISAMVAVRLMAASSRHAGEKQEEIDMLLHYLGDISRCEAQNTLTTLLSSLIEGAPLCLRIMLVEPKLVDRGSLTQAEMDGVRRAALKFILHRDRTMEDRQVDAFMSWAVQNEQESRLVGDLLDAGEETPPSSIYGWSLLLRKCLAPTTSLHDVDETRLSVVLFQNLLATLFASDEDAFKGQQETTCSEMVLGMLREVKSPDITRIRAKLDAFLSDVNVPVESVKRLALLLRGETAAPAALDSLFIPDVLEELKSLSLALDTAYLCQMLMTEESMLLPYALQVNSSMQASNDTATILTPARLLLDGMRRCVFNCAGQAAAQISLAGWFLRTMASDAERWGLSRRQDVTTTTSSEWKNTVDALPCRQRTDSIDELIEFTMAISNCAPLTHHLPLSVVYALKRTLSMRQSIDSTLFIKKLAGAKLSSVHEDPRSFPLQALLLKFVLSCEQFTEEDSHKLVSIVTSEATEDKEVLNWLVEMTRASALFTRENRAQYIVSLDLFLTEMRQDNSPLAGMEEWLFTVQHLPEKLRDSTSYAILRLCSKCIPHLLEVGSTIRDFINCGFVTALQSCTEVLVSASPHRLADSLTLLHASACVEIYDHYTALVRLNEDRGEYTEIRQEWHDFFGPSATSFIMKWFLEIDQLTLHSVNAVAASEFTSRLCAAIHSSLDAEMVLKAELAPGRAEAFLDDSVYFDGYPDGLRGILEPHSHLILNPRVGLEIGLAAAHVMKIALLDMFRAEKCTSGRAVIEGPSSPETSALPPTPSADEEEGVQSEESVERLLPRLLTEIFLHPPENITDTEQERIPPILLCWWSFVHLLAELDPNARESYTEGLTPQMLSNVFVQLFAAMPDQLAGTTDEGNRLLFEEPVNYQQLAGYAMLREKVTCRLYYKTCTVVPTLLRQWYSSLNSAAAAIISKYTKRYVSPSLVRRELKAIGNQKRGHLEVKVRQTANEVEALYKFEGHSIQLEMRLPDNYPLAATKIQAAEKAMLDKKTNRRWLLQLEMYLNRQEAVQNGPILDGIMRWKRNIDQHLTGKEECVICMAVISATNSQTPTKRCRGCTKKFHPKCLEDWFRKGSSELPTCPLCRATFF